LKPTLSRHGAFIAAGHHEVMALTNQPSVARTLVEENL